MEKNGWTRFSDLWQALKLVRDVFVPTYKQTAEPVQMTSYTFKGNEFQKLSGKISEGFEI